MPRFAITIVLILGLAPHAWAQSAPLPEGVRAMLESAAARDAAEGTTRYLETALTLARDAYPDRSDDLNAVASSLSPTGNAVVASETPPPPPPPAEEPPAEPPVPSGFFSFSGWSGSVELGATLTTGDTDEKAVTAAFALLNERQKWRHKLGVGFDFTRTSGATTKQALAAYYQLDYKFSERLYAFGRIEYDDDRFSGFDWELQEALGVGYRLFEGDSYFFDVEGGVIYEQMKLTATGMTESQFGGRANAIFNWDISETFSLNNETTVLVTEGGESLENTIAVQTKITDSISGKLSFNVEWESDVPAGASKTNTETKATVIYGF
ncbi:MAG: YdiY family protein [Alphaproteobacteria bacterium]